MSSIPKVLFVCLHGSAKSVVAAAHLRRLAAHFGVDLEAEAAGVEPDPEIPPHVRAGLAEDGIDIGHRRPTELTAWHLASANHIVSLGCDLRSRAPAGVEITLWNDIPAVSDGYEAARSAIVDMLLPLLEQLRVLPEGDNPTVDSR